VEKEIADINAKQEVESQKTSEIENKMQEIVLELKTLKQTCQAAQEKLSQLEKEEVSLKENEKYINQRKKKLTKSITEERHQHSEDTVWLSNFEADVEKAKKEKVELKARLEKEEQILQDIQSSLQGIY
jgi:structural maintenance of chromosome 4